MLFYILFDVHMDQEGKTQVKITKRTRHIFKDLTVKPKLINSFKLKNKSQKADGTMIMVDITHPTSIFPRIILFFVGSVSNQIGIIPFNVTNILLSKHHLLGFRNEDYMVSKFQEDNFKEFIGSAGPKHPFFSACTVNFCIFFSLDIFGESPNVKSLHRFDSSFPGIKEPFCPKWIKGNSGDESGSLYLLSNCGNRQYTLYKASLSFSIFEFEEINLPELTDNEVNDLDITAMNKLQILYIKNTLKAWIVRLHQFEYLMDFLP